MLKWPNDVVVDDRKLAGVLVEASHSRSGSAACVVGVGFNLALAASDSGAIDQPWTDFARTFGRVPVRSALASRAANALLDACEQFRDGGLAPFLARWDERDALRDRPVRVLSAAWAATARRRRQEGMKTRISPDSKRIGGPTGPSRNLRVGVRGRVLSLCCAY